MRYTMIRAAVLVAGICPAMASAQTTVTLTGNVLNTCLLTVTTPGTMALSLDRQSLGSEEVGGIPATMTVAATGTSPTLTFAEASLDAPAGYTATANELRYSSLSSPTPTAYQSTPDPSSATLIDTFTINGRTTSTTGYPAGSYTLQTVVTCSQ